MGAENQNTGPLARRSKRAGISLFAEHQLSKASPAPPPHCGGRCCSRHLPTVGRQEGEWYFSQVYSAWSYSRPARASSAQESSPLPGLSQRRSLVPLLVGTSGWQYQDWRGAFYPDRLPAAKWLEHYATRFPTVENNGTFYRLAAAGTFDSWRARTPPGFLMAVKASRYLTHVRRLRDPAEPVGRLLGVAIQLG